MELISRADAIKDAESWVAVDEHERHLQKNVIEWLKEFPTAELGTNLAEVGTYCISRQAAIEALDKRFDSIPMEQTSEILMLRKDLRELPPAQPERSEPKRGEWLERDVIDEPKGKHITQWQSARCSVCGRYHTTPYLYSFTHYNFCPNCGADMREVTT